MKMPKMPWRSDNRPQRYRPPINARRKTVIVASVIVLAAAVSFGGWQLDSYISNVSATCMNTGVTVVMHDHGDCVGITDGAYQFDPGSATLDNVEAKIRAEDQKVRASGQHYVSVAYLLPFSTSPGSAVPIGAATEELAGAYTAQRYANNPQHDVEGTRSPQVQLLIASNGTQGAGYQAVDREIENDVKSQNLAAVAGIGVSLSSTVAEAKELTSAGIPVFGSDVSSDQFDSIKKMVRVSPSNSAAVSAVLGYIKAKYHSAFLISDQNESDSYVSTLVSDFPKFAGGSNKIVQSEEYDSSAGENAAYNRVGQMAGDICASHAQVVLFAGRGRDLGALLSAFGTSQQCGNSDNPDDKITIVTVGDVTNLQPNSAIEAGLRNVDLYYAGETIPGEWADKTCDREAAAVGSQGSSDFTQTYSFNKELPSQDGVAMIGYDAMLTATSAIRLAAGNGVSPTPSGVAQELSALQGQQHSVPGASGPISFANYSSPTDGSNPVRKVFPILQLLPNGNAQFVQCVQTNP